jgi:hypothetical protein
LKLLLAFMSSLIMSAVCHSQGWQISAGASHLFGSTCYRYDAMTYSPSNPDDIYPIASELEFPLDVWLAGVAVDWRLPGGKWAATAALAMNVSAPVEKMMDDDWQRGRWIQHTESEAELTLLSASLEARRHLLSVGPVPVALAGYLSYQHIAEDMTGYEGWYYNDILQLNFPISGTDPTMNYKVDYLSPQAGLAASVSLPFLLTLNAQSTAGVVFAWDSNDHLLRGKRAEGDATGFGMHSALKVSGSPFHLSVLPVIFGLGGEFRYFYANGTSSQTWYRDEGTSNGVIPAGTTYSGLPHDFRSTQWETAIFLGIQF